MIERSLVNSEIQPEQEISVGGREEPDVRPDPTYPKAIPDKAAEDYERTEEQGQQGSPKDVQKG